MSQNKVVYRFELENDNGLKRVKILYLQRLYMSNMWILTYSSTDNFSSPVLVSDWLILWSRNLIIYQKKK